MSSAVSPGISKVSTELMDDREKGDEISDQGNLQRGPESKIDEKSNLGNEKGEVVVTEGNGKAGGSDTMDPKENAEQKGVSWVEVAQEGKVMKKYDMEITEQEGQKSVEIPDEVIEKVNHLWEDYLIGKFLDTAPHIAKIHATVNRIWNQRGKKELIDVHIVDGTTMKFKVMNPMMRERILKRGMWSIGNVPMVITKWIPDEMKEKPEIKSIPLWVHLKNVPMHMFSWQGLSFITSAAGVPVRLHPETAACKNFKLAKVFVKADLTKELPSKINFTKNGVSSLVEFTYPWLPFRCNTCGKWGHTEKVCIMNKKDGSEKSVKQIINAGIKGKDGQEIKEVDKVVKSGALVDKVMDSSKKNEVITEKDNRLEEGEIKERWEEVTPSKGSTRSSPLKFGQVKLLTPSRFSALSGMDEKGDSMHNVEFEEIISVEEETIVEGINGELSSEGEDKRNEELESGKEMKEDSNMKKGSEEENTTKSIAGIEHWPDLTATLRPSLPRKSKTMHKFVSDKAQGGSPGKVGKSHKNSSQ